MCKTCRTYDLCMFVQDRMGQDPLHHLPASSRATTLGIQTDLQLYRVALQPPSTSCREVTQQWNRSRESPFCIIDYNKVYTYTAE